MSLAELKHALRRTLDRLRWWWCARMESHDFTPILVTKYPTYTDHTVYGATTMCRRCKMMMTARYALSALQQATSKDPDIEEYVKARLIRQLLAQQIYMNGYVVEQFDHWMDETKPWRTHDRS